MDPPARPVWEMLRDYGGPRLEHPAADAEMLAALSWCETRRNISEWVGEARAQGDLPAGSLQTLTAEHTRVQQLCGRLSDSDLGLRIQILRLHAQAGQVEAQLAFLGVGPTGRWPDPEREHLPLDGTQLAAWRLEVLGYLHQAVTERPSDALSTLAFLYDPGAPVPMGEPLLGPLRNLVEGHAYRLVWQDYPSAEVSRQAAMAFVQREAARLTTEQLAQARARAVVLRSELPLPPPSLTDR